MIKDLKKQIEQIKEGYKKELRDLFSKLLEEKSESITVSLDEDLKNVLVTVNKTENSKNSHKNIKYNFSMSTKVNEKQEEVVNYSVEASTVNIIVDDFGRILGTYSEPTAMGLQLIQASLGTIEKFVKGNNAIEDKE